MEAVIFDGKEYIKASVLAARFRYTADYLGQLCRGKKVDARLVGRAWYINLDSLNSHRNGRYKNASNKSEKPLADAKKADPVPAAKTVIKSHYLSRIDVEPILKKKTVALFTEKKGVVSSVPVKYEADENALIPRVNKEAVSKNLPIIPAEAEKVRVHKEGSNTTAFKAESLPEIYLKGKLSVAGLEEASEQAIVEEEKIEPEIKISRMDETLKVKPLLVRRLHKLPNIIEPAALSKPILLGHNKSEYTPQRPAVGSSTEHHVPVIQRPVLQRSNLVTEQRPTEPRFVPIGQNSRNVPLVKPPTTPPAHQSNVISNKIKISEVGVKPEMKSPVLPRTVVPATKRKDSTQTVIFKPKTVLKTEAVKAEEKQQSSSMLLPLFSLLCAMAIAIAVLGVREEISVGAGTLESSNFVFSFEEMRARF
ncbi:MAG: hypothetical protein RLZZ480_782 [Candidatus Parcubacteria bacterium]|jgi:hypothetical protein